VIPSLICRQHREAMDRRLAVTAYVDGGAEEVIIVAVNGTAQF
jgi:hypothetical protein